jgi:biopolymer transport protein ExbD
MAMSTPRDEEHDDLMVDINTTPLIDVMLVLLIMLIITIPVQLHSVNMNMPVGEPPVRTEPPPVLRIDIGPDGSIRFDGETVADRSELHTRLQGIAAMPEQPEVHLRPDRLAAYSVVAMVMATAQRVGVTKLGLIGSEQFVR